MNIRNITTGITVLTLSIGIAATASAQNFIPQTYGHENYGGTHADAMRVLGAPAQHRGNQGLPMVDTVPQYSRPVGGYNDIQVEWRGNTIFNPEQRTANYNYNYQPYNGQFNTAQLQASIQQFQQAVQQIRANRQHRQQLYYQQQYQNYNQPYYQWGWR